MQKFGIDSMLEGSLLVEFVEEMIEKERSEILDNFLNKVAEEN